MREGGVFQQRRGVHLWCHERPDGERQGALTFHTHTHARTHFPPSTQATFSIPDPLFRGVAIRGFWLMPWTASLAPEERAAVLQEVMGLLASGVITPYSGGRGLTLVVWCGVVWV